MAQKKDLNASIGEQNTFQGQAARDIQDRQTRSLGDQVTFGGSSNTGDLEDDAMEIVDLATRYKIEKTLGKGGMGEVLLATDTRLGRKIAIKRILGDAARSRTAVNRFLTEAKSIAALNHSNIVQIHDYGRAVDGPFLIMEFVGGNSLLDRCRSGPLPLEEAIEITCQLCDGLGKAHAAGIIHRDIKPANILMTADGIPKLTDFGLAKAESSDTGMTMAGAMLGTLDFMPPEQRRDAALADARSDLWSLAATLYQMVTGESPRVIDLDLCPQELRSALARGLKTKQEDRFQSAIEFRDALRASRQGGRPELSQLEQGQCPGCGTRNDASRRFCRNPACGASLEVACLACAQKLPVWEEVCGNCGSKQRQLVDAQRQAKDAAKIEAEAALERGDFRSAQEIATTLAAENDPRLRQLVTWATEFLGTTEQEYARQREHLAQLLVEAQQHEAAHDYPSAIKTLEQVAEPLRGDLLAGSPESAAEALARVRKKQAEAQTLEQQIRTRVSNRELQNLLPAVEHLLRLLPHRADVLKLKGQLIDRDEKLQQVKEESLSEARQAFTAQDYLRCLAALDRIDRSAEDGETGRLREDARTADERVRELDLQITQRLATKQYDGLLEMVEAYLALQREDTERQQLRTQLLDRKDKQRAQLQLVLQAAEKLRSAGNFDGALAKLQPIPTALRSDEVQAVVSALAELQSSQQQALEALSRAEQSGEYATGLAHASAYATMLSADASIQDMVFGEKYTQVQAALETQKRRKRTIKIAAIGSVPTLLLLSIAGCVWGLYRWRANQLAWRASQLASVINEFEFKLLPAGSFVMGEGGASHQVTLTTPFLIGVYEVTQEQYERVMGTNPSEFKGAQNPVGNVSWEDAVEFCRKLSAIPAEKAAGRVYRLPTEAEWEYACRAGTTTKYYFGNDESQLGEYAWYDQNSGSTTHPVGRKRPNAWGLYDMHGNVWEWCNDWYGDYPQGTAQDPQGPSKGSFRVNRGGGWLSEAAFCRSALRNGYGPSLRSSLNGFRLALSSPEIPK